MLGHGATEYVKIWNETWSVEARGMVPQWDRRYVEFPDPSF